MSTTTKNRKQQSLDGVDFGAEQSNNQLTEKQRQELADLKKVAPANEFGGAIGTPLLTFGLPIVVYWLWASLEFNQGFPLRPESLSLEGFQKFFGLLYTLVMEHAYPTKEAAIIYFSWFFFQVALQHFVPGKHVLGSPLPGGARLPYVLNGWASWWITMIAVPVAVYFGLFKATILYDNYGPMLTVVNLWSFVFTALLKIHAVVKNEEERMSGYFFYDFWMGFARNPRIGSFDLKLFCEARPGLILWVLMNFSIAAKQFEQFGYIPFSTVIVSAFHFWYIADYYYHEEAILTTMDIITEKFGYMLVYGDLAWVPFTYCFQTYYILKHTDASGNPQTLTPLYTIAVLALFAFGYYLFRWVNSQKHAFRRNPDELIWGKKPQFILTKRGTKLLTSGFWGICRHLNYTGDIIISWAWCLPCQFDSIVPYFYGIYFTTLDLHRCHRDHRACVEKYGDDWKEYCRRVPYIFIPKIF
ncbi:hypothetical protein SAMD00019534_011460 [Acytostelium subglobosum LB1]|uniref:hypothetical protein n=1 Tax=Acytostelium subglobosum LB1 TaxID=1410327 RepID=UPI000644AE4F|nr:hypothetical protein SAMD00019534_011460 [Acytostelium subglobosum LB1]GAM17971.1 hypothetical protein SAMD00019534_011460 [Acytostelium subglobosum LB1]|eukprot:XP_012758567.1 hypothetical protein SAMD00019534_011460 [Acytostelium subglobosum LB1]